jgi:myosin heavy subunit
VQLEELGLLGRRADNKALLQMYHNTHLATNEHYSKPRFEAPEFIVHHFAGQVTVSCLLTYLYCTGTNVYTVIC